MTRPARQGRLRRSPVACRKQGGDEVLHQPRLLRIGAEQEEGLEVDLRLERPQHQTTLDEALSRHGLRQPDTDPLQGQGADRGGERRLHHHVRTRPRCVQHCIEACPGPILGGQGDESDAV